jgi:subtilisin family serine protease
MLKHYHIFIKKSIFWLTIGSFFVFTAPVLAKIPTDPLYSQQETMWQQINAPLAWDYSAGSRQVVVAIIDIGLDINHPDLKNNIWRNIDEIPNNGKDDDQNGYIDDINGWNFIENNNKITIDILAENDKETINHGTETAGLIGASNNFIGGVGVNWNVRIMSLRAVDNDGNGFLGALDEAIDYAVKNGADVINLSLVSNTYIEALKDSMKRAFDKGVVLVAAAGNEQLNSEGNL